MTAKLDDGYTKIANQIVDKLCCTRLGGYESMVLWCVFRKTYGFNKKEDWIANSQISKQTGLYKSHISRSIKELIKMNIVTKNGNMLKINKDTSSWLPKMVTNKNVTKIGNTVTKNGISKLPKMADTKETITKETIQKKEREKISIYDLTDFHFQTIAERYKVPMGFVQMEYEKMVNWHESSGKQRKDWVATLRNFVLRDAEERITHAKQVDNKRGIDASNL